MFIRLLVDLKYLKLTDEEILALVEKSKGGNLLNNPVDITDDMLLKMYSTLSE